MVLVGNNREIPIKRCFKKNEEAKRNSFLFYFIFRGKKFARIKARDLQINNTILRGKRVDVVRKIMSFSTTIFYVIDLRASVKDFEPFSKFLERFKAGCCDYAKRCTLLSNDGRLYCSVITIGKEVKFIIEVFYLILFDFRMDECVSNTCSVPY